MKLVWLATVALAGCVRVTDVDDGLDRAARYARLESLTAWRMRGRIAVDAAGEAYQGRFRWQRDGERLTLWVGGPLGAGAVEVDGTADAMLVRARDGSWALTDPEVQLSELLGWWLPITSLEDWLLGLPDDAYPAEPLYADAGLLAALEQRLWRIDYPEYQLAAGIAVPRTIEMSHEALRLTLTVDDLAPLTASAP